MASTGRWVAPRIFFMEFVGVIWFGNIHIDGFSGIFFMQLFGK
jgi:hypothetical protein